MLDARITQLETIEDPRWAWKGEHRLLDILVIAVCAVLGEAENFEDIALAALVGLLLARRMTVPIRALQQGAARIGGGDFAHRISIRTGDEPGRTHEIRSLNPGGLIG